MYVKSSLLLMMQHYLNISKHKSGKLLTLELLLMGLLPPLLSSESEKTVTLQDAACASISSPEKESEILGSANFNNVLAQKLTPGLKLSEEKEYLHGFVTVISLQ